MLICARVGLKHNLTASHHTKHWQRKVTVNVKQGNQIRMLDTCVSLSRVCCI